MAKTMVPDGLPVLSRGKHRTPRSGACFMEMASVLAGEKWSDQPQCTHPLLGGLARLVNDSISDTGRRELVEHIPSVVGVRGEGLGWEVSLVAAVAVEAILDVPEERQRALASGLIRCEELAVALGPGQVHGVDAMRQALADVPLAVRWSRRYLTPGPITSNQFRRNTAPTMIRCSVLGIATGASADPDARLRDLLVTGIDAARRGSEPSVRAPHAEVLRG
ncbi:hypothetical protein [Nocardioides caricicola]|uniref:DUF222 domain-containing protein n=1 Tax=Nocardioides caricicola TaxID=634770 RepID=A0ABW0N2N7_9ACTN